MLTIYGWFGYGLPMKDLCRLIRQTGFEGACFWWGDDFGDAGYRSNPELARKEGLFVENIHMPFEGGGDIWLDGLDGEDYAGRLLRCVEDCRAYEIPAMVVHLMTGSAPPPCGDIGIIRLRRVVDKAEQYGVTIALENLQKADFLTYVYDRIQSDRLGFCYDSGHHNCFTPEKDLLSLYGGKLAVLHLHDNAGRVRDDYKDDQHRLPFDGTADWPAIMKKIAVTGYKGPTALELSGDYTREYAHPADFLAVACERAKRLEELRLGFAAATCKLPQSASPTAPSEREP